MDEVKIVCSLGNAHAWIVLKCLISLATHPMTENTCEYYVRTSSSMRMRSCGLLARDIGSADPVLKAVMDQITSTQKGWEYFSPPHRKTTSIRTPNVIQILASNSDFKIKWQNASERPLDP